MQVCTNWYSHLFYTCQQQSLHSQTAIQMCMQSRRSLQLQCMHAAQETYCPAGASSGVGGSPKGVALLTGSLASTFCFRCRAEKRELPPGNSTGAALSKLSGGRPFEPFAILLLLLWSTAGWAARWESSACDVVPAVASGMSSS